ncbi:hypothetical protein EC973_005628, partial [Apophysomyces ossiformis]
SEEELRQLNEEGYKVPVLVASHKEQLQFLIGRISRFAIEKIKRELSIARKYEIEPCGDCNCKCKINFNLPCRHTLPRFEPVGLDLIAKRWYLRPEESYDSPCDVPKEKIAVRSIEERCADAVYLLESQLRDAENDQQRIDILSKIKPILKVNHSVSVQDVKLPTKVAQKGRPKGAVGNRLPSGFELAEAKAEKKKDKDTTVSNAAVKRKLEQASTLEQPEAKRFHGESQKEVQEDRCHSENHFVVDVNIPKENYINTIDVRGDGYCGFRVLALLLKGDENEFLTIKRAMLKELDDNIEVYRKYFNYPVDELRKIIAYGHDIEKPTDAFGCSYEYWFDAGICAQLAADTFRTPIAIYSDAGTRSVVTEDGTQTVFIHPPVLYLPYKCPSDAKNPPMPLVMHFVHGNHWATVVMKRSRKMTWPPVYYKHRVVCAQLQLDDRIRSYWNRHLSIKKVKMISNASKPIELD